MDVKTHTCSQVSVYAPTQTYTHAHQPDTHIGGSRGLVLAYTKCPTIPHPTLPAHPEKKKKRKEKKKRKKEKKKRKKEREQTNKKLETKQQQQQQQQQKI